MSEYIYITPFPALLESYPNGFVLYQNMTCPHSPSVSWMMIP